jgi:H+/Cl- antiporter ClcA
VSRRSRGSSPRPSASCWSSPPPRCGSPIPRCRRGGPSPTRGGCLATAVTQIASGFIAIALIVYSYRRFHGKPEAVRALEGQIEDADREYDEVTRDD